MKIESVSQNVLRYFIKFDFTLLIGTKIRVGKISIVELTSTAPSVNTY